MERNIASLTMVAMKKQLVIFLSILNYSMQKSSPEDDYYVATVVEFPLRESCNVTENLNQYVEIIKQASKQDADIIVYPEKTLTGFCESVQIPLNSKLKKYPIPADNEDKYNYFQPFASTISFLSNEFVEISMIKILVELSQAARDNEIYVVANVQELLDCRQPQKGEQCPEKRKYYFSTNIVFDREGNLIARTRKINLFGEPFHIESFSTDNMGSFTTDFGVTFVNIIELDIIFQVPQIELISQNKVSDVVFTAAWYSELSYFTAVQTQKAISTYLDINMLASGANSWDKHGSGGSGIYSGKAGTLVSIMRKVTSYRLLVAEVPKTPGMVKKKYSGPIEVNPAMQDSLITLTDTSFDKFLTQILEPGYQEISLDYQDISCKFIVNITLGCGNQHYRYRVAAFSGVRKLVVDATGGVRTCSIIACTGDDIYTCGMRFPKYSRASIGWFSELTVIGTVPKRIIDPVTKLADSTFFVTSLKTSLSSLQPNEMDFQEIVQRTDSVHTISLKNYKAELYAFGFYGRKFGDDGKPVTMPLIENIITKMNMNKDKS